MAYDLKNVPTISLTEAEVDDIRAQIAAGELPPDYLKRCEEARARNVFGHDAKKDRNGNYIEQGSGSAFNQTRNSVEAYRRHGVNDPDYLKNLARMEKELIAANDRRRAEKAARSADA